MLLFRSKGFEATAIKEITDAAGVSVGNFFHYFSSKNDILAENFHEDDGIFLALEDSSLFRSQGSERIVEYLCIYAKFVASVGFDFSKELYTYKTGADGRQREAPPLSLPRRRPVSFTLKGSFR